MSGHPSTFGIPPQWSFNIRPTRGETCLIRAIPGLRSSARCALVHAVALQCFEDLRQACAIALFMLPVRKVWGEVFPDFTGGVNAGVRVKASP